MHLNGKARGVQRSARATLMNDTCHSIELGSASMPLFLEETLLDECMYRLINQVAVRTGGSHSLVSLDSTRLNFGRRSPVGAHVWVVAAVAHPKIGRPTPVLAHQLASAYKFFSSFSPRLPPSALHTVDLGLPPTLLTGRPIALIDSGASFPVPFSSNRERNEFSGGQGSCRAAFPPGSTGASPSHYRHLVSDSQ